MDYFLNRHGVVTAFTKDETHLKGWIKSLRYVQSKSIHKKIGDGLVDRSFGSDFI